MGTTSVRHPAVAGQFYPRNAATLLSEVRSYLSGDAAPMAALGCIVPHAGYIYSGHVAGAVYARVDIPGRCFLLCPNHTGIGTPLSIMAEGSWETPLGSVPVDSELASTLLNEFPALTADSSAHRAEHGIEVQLPFLQARRSHFRFVPIAIGTSQFEALEALGQAIGQIVAAQSERILILASSDMNHYESDQITRIKDHKAIERILTLDPRGLYDVVMNEDISMCGYGPAVAMLTAVKHLGGTRAELIRYATSGDVSGDRKMVVGYAGIAVM
jgi:MEMO1 family protein